MIIIIIIAATADKNCKLNDSIPVAPVPYFEFSLHAPLCWREPLGEGPAPRVTSGSFSLSCTLIFVQRCVKAKMVLHHWSKVGTKRVWLLFLFLLDRSNKSFSWEAWPLIQTLIQIMRAVDFRFACWTVWPGQSVRARVCVRRGG